MSVNEMLGEYMAIADKQDADEVFREIGNAAALASKPLTTVATEYVMLMRGFYASMPDIPEELQ